MTKFDLGVKWGKLTKSHILNNLGNTCVPDATYQVSSHQSIDPEEDFVRFLPYMIMAAMLVM